MILCDVFRRAILGLCSHSQVGTFAASQTKRDGA